MTRLSFLHNQLAQRAAWSQQDYNRYLKAKFFIKYGKPTSVHMTRNLETVRFLAQHYGWDGTE